MSVSFDTYYAARPAASEATNAEPLSNGYPVAQTDMESVETVTPGTLVWALTAFTGGLKGRYVGVTRDAYGDRAVLIQLTADYPAYQHRETITVRPDVVHVRRDRHVSGGRIWFAPRPLLFVPSV